MSRRKSVWALLLASGAAALLGCNPELDSQVAALGPETAGIAPGPTHRPGQPCLVCHHEGGPAQPAFAMAGTIYRQKGVGLAIGNVDVELTDPTGRKIVARSNCAGNFYVAPADFPLVYPVWVALRSGTHSIEMESPIYREGSCATCHANQVGPSSAGPAYLTDEPAKVQQFTVTPCPK
jgi:hypothetical protein